MLPVWVAPDADRAAAKVQTDRLKDPILQAGIPPLFWQFLLASSLSARSATQVLESLVDEPRDPIGFLLNEVLTPAQAQAVQSKGARALEEALSKGAKLCLPDQYPERLQEIEDPPPALFYRGNLDCLHQPTVAIVGTRGASTYGSAVAAKFSTALLKAGVTVISGGALGIDAAAQEAACALRAPTVVVMGTGIDKVNPPRHRQLFEDIVASGGLLVSQFACGTPSLQHNFPARNHLIAALSDVVLVVEAPAKSGALTTAHAAADFGRDVMVVPSSITQESFRGSHGLIRDGAMLVDHPQQVLRALGIESSDTLSTSTSLSEVQLQILGALNHEPQPAEKVVQATGLEAAQVLTELTMLEMSGQVLKTPLGFATKP